VCIIPNRLHDSLKLLKLRPAVCIVIKKTAILNTCRVVRKISTEQWKEVLGQWDRHSLRTGWIAVKWGMWITILLIIKTTVTCDALWRNAPLMLFARALSDDGGTSVAVALCGLRCSENWRVTRFMFWTRDATRVVVCWTRDAADCIGFCSVTSGARIESVALHWTSWCHSILSA